MARLLRLTLAGCAHHVIQRGNNRQPVFSSAEDHLAMIELLREHGRRLDVAVHAYVLMSNHFHLLATPATDDGIPKLMQAVGRSYVRRFNDAHGRSGTLWEGRYRSTLIQAERYLLDCMVYIDLNPVRAGLVTRPADYRWSSHQHYVGQSSEPMLTPHRLYWALGNTPFAREAAYADLVRTGLSPPRESELTESALRGWVLGEPGFLSELQQRTRRRLSRAVAGRPRRSVPYQD